MAYRKSTLRTMSPTARKVARLIGEQESVARRLKNLIPELQRLDLESAALKTAKQPPALDFGAEFWELIYSVLEKEWRQLETWRDNGIISQAELTALDQLHAKLKAMALPKRFICLWCKKTTDKPTDHQCPNCDAVDSLVDYEG